MKTLFKYVLILGMIVPNIGTAYSQIVIPPSPTYPTPKGVVGCTTVCGGSGCTTVCQ
jgi:hypothetical protein